MNCTTCSWFVLCTHLRVILRSIDIGHTNSHCAVQTFKTWNSSAISLSHLSYSGQCSIILISDIWHSSCSESHLGSLNASKKHPWWPRPTRKTTVLPGQTAQKDTERVVSLHADKQLRLEDVHTRWQGHLPTWKAVTCTHRSHIREACGHGDIGED